MSGYQEQKLGDLLRSRAARRALRAALSAVARRHAMLPAASMAFPQYDTWKPTVENVVCIQGRTAELAIRDHRRRHRHRLHSRPPSTPARLRCGLHARPRRLRIRLRRLQRDAAWAARHRDYLHAWTRGKSDPIYQQQLRKMGHRFGNINLYMLEKWPPTSQELDEIVLRHNITDLVLEKSGERDGVLTTVRGVRNLVHANVAGSHPHGDVYARVSSSISGTAPVVPLVVRPPPPDSAIGPDLRGPTGIPGKCEWPKDGCPTIAANATVFCRHGGQGQFNIPWAREAVLEGPAIDRTLSFYFSRRSQSAGGRAARGISSTCRTEVSTLSATTARATRCCMRERRARRLGCSSEFSVRNKPVITCNNTWYFYKTAMAHVAALGDKGIYYQSKAALLEQLLAFNRTEAARRDWRAYSGFDPPTVMARFDAVFLRGGDG